MVLRLNKRKETCTSTVAELIARSGEKPGGQKCWHRDLSSCCDAAMQGGALMALEEYIGTSNADICGMARHYGHLQ